MKPPSSPLFRGEQFAKWLRGARIRRNISMRDAVKESGVTLSAFSRAENAKGIPSAEIYLRLKRWIEQ